VRRFSSSIALQSVAAESDQCEGRTSIGGCLRRLSWKRPCEQRCVTLYFSSLLFNLYGFVSSIFIATFHSGPQEIFQRVGVKEHISTSARHASKQRSEQIETYLKETLNSDLQLCRIRGDVFDDLSHGSVFNDFRTEATA
jgi:hypothetical protein